MDHASASFASPWAAAVLGGHANSEHGGFGHPGLSMDLHGYSYYRCEMRNIEVAFSCFRHDKFPKWFMWFVPHEKLKKEARRILLSCLWTTKERSKLSFWIKNRFKFVYKILRSRFKSTSNISMIIAFDPCNYFVNSLLPDTKGIVMQMSTLFAIKT